MRDGSIEILLVTTRESKRWIIPKGGPIKGLKPQKSAAREAFEEAGIRGAIGGKAIGSFKFDKTLSEEGILVPCEVFVYPLLVKRQHKTWPEFNERTSCWCESEKALAILKDEGLRNIIAELVNGFVAPKKFQKVLANPSSRKGKKTRRLKTPG